MNWLYTDEIQESEIDDDRRSGPSDVSEQSVMWPVELYVIGVKLEDEQFQDCVMTEMYKLFINSHTDTGFAWLASEMLLVCGSESKPRELLIDWIMEMKVMADGRKANGATLSLIDDLDFFRELSVQFLTEREGHYDSPWDKGPCKHHLHKHDDDGGSEFICSFKSGRVARG